MSFVAPNVLAREASSEASPSPKPVQGVSLVVPAIPPGVTQNPGARSSDASLRELLQAEPALDGAAEKLSTLGIQGPRFPERVTSAYLSAISKEAQELGNVLKEICSTTRLPQPGTHLARVALVYLAREHSNRDFHQRPAVATLADQWRNVLKAAAVSYGNLCGDLAWNRTAGGQVRWAGDYLPQLANRIAAYFGPHLSEGQQPYFSPQGERAVVATAVTQAFERLADALVASKRTGVGSSPAAGANAQALLRFVKSQASETSPAQQAWERIASRIAA